MASLLCTSSIIGFILFYLLLLFYFLSIQYFLFFLYDFL